MRTFFYRCPTTGFRVQGCAPEQTSDAADTCVSATCVSVACYVCAKVHLVNPFTSKVAGEPNE
jgi:hypothetical protein